MSNIIDDKGPTFKFTFQISTSTGEFYQFRNEAHQSVAAHELQKFTKQFFDAVPGMVERAEKVHAEKAARRRK